MHIPPANNQLRSYFCLICGRWSESELLPFPLILFCSSPTRTTCGAELIFSARLLFCPYVFQVPYWQESVALAAGCTLLADTPMLLLTNWCYWLSDAISDRRITGFYCFLDWCLFLSEHLFLSWNINFSPDGKVFFVDLEFLVESDEKIIPLIMETVNVN